MPAHRVRQQAENGRSRTLVRVASQSQEACEPPGFPQRDHHRLLLTSDRRIPTLRRAAGLPDRLLALIFVSLEPDPGCLLPEPSGSFGLMKDPSDISYAAFLLPEVYLRFT